MIFFHWLFKILDAKWFFNRTPLYLKKKRASKNKLEKNIKSVVQKLLLSYYAA